MDHIILSNEFHLIHLIIISAKECSYLLPTLLSLRAPERSKISLLSGLSANPRHDIHDRVGRSGLRRWKKKLRYSRFSIIL